jgi:hypothetical protein
MAEHAPPLVSRADLELTPEQKRRISRRPLFRAGT